MYATRSNVEAAIHTLQASGQKITARSIREALGGHGSLEDIARFVREILLGEPAADDAPGLPEIAYALPTPNPEVVACHLAHLQGEAELNAMISHLWAVIGAVRALQPVVPGAMNFLHRYGQSMGQMASGQMGLSLLHEQLQASVESAQHLLHRIEREYAALKAYETGEQDDGRTTAATREPDEGGDAGNS